MKIVMNTYVNADKKTVNEQMLVTEGVIKSFTKDKEGNYERTNAQGNSFRVAVVKADFSKETILTTIPSKLIKLDAEGNIIGDYAVSSTIGIGCKQITDARGTITVGKVYFESHNKEALNADFAAALAAAKVEAPAATVAG